jgi:hypothetical protein
VARHPDVAQWDDNPSGSQEVAEVPLLLSAGILETLEGVASRRGLTAGQLLRRLVGDFLGRTDGQRPPAGGAA